MICYSRNNTEALPVQNKQGKGNSMSYITVRYLVSTAAVIVSFAVGGSTFAGNPEQSAPSVQQPAATTVYSVAAQPSPAEVQGEAPNTNGRVYNITLGVGEYLSDSIVTAIKVMDPQLRHDQVDGVTQVLLDDIKTEAGVTDLDNLPPGVSVSIFKKVDHEGKVTLDAYVSKNSGIQQEVS